MNRDDWDRRYAAADLVWTAEPNRFLVAEAGALPAGRALDVAAGEGRNAVWLAKQGWQVTAVDFSEVALAKGRQMADAAGVSVEWVAADVVGFRPEPRSFDLVVILYLHLPASQRREVVRAMAQAVAPGGTLLVVGHDTDNLTRGVGGPQSPEVLFSPADIVADLDAALVIERAEQVHRLVTTDAGDREAIDALVRAHRPDS